MANLEQGLAALKQYFGYESFRPLQEKTITYLLEGKDVLTLMPTGGGKSICFQIPAIILEGTCIVVSPLIALMQDQVEGLVANGIRAAFLNSSQTPSEQQDIETRLLQRQLDLLYISPEKIISPGFIPVLNTIKINLFAIDEAHCISMWGHDFRQEYTKLGFIREQFPGIPILALTASAEKVTRLDITRQLGIPEEHILVASFDRPNIYLEVRPGRKRMEQITDFVHHNRKQSGIVYCLSRKSTEQVAARLQAAGYKAAFYHAGMSARDRASTQSDFIADRTQIICATIAFGMGIDKSNVRWIIHYNLPKNMEGYYQEIGRAGRDGLPAQALLFYTVADLQMLRDMLTQQESNQAELQLAKLERIQQYAESLVCRRRVLLNYFGEPFHRDCDNCDTCKQPHSGIDGTIIAQKALSALYRTGGRESNSLLIHILRGSRKKEVLEKNYHELKSYGCGAEHSYEAWQFYLVQLRNLGYLESPPDQKNMVLINDASKRVLFSGEKVKLIRFSGSGRSTETPVKISRGPSQTQRDLSELYDLLIELRRSLAVKAGIPPYSLLSDADIQSMIEQLPVSTYELHSVSGMSQKKIADYGNFFRQAILSFVSDRPLLAKKKSKALTFAYLEKGLSLEEIASLRQLKLVTIEDHAAQLYTDGFPLDIRPFLPLDAEVVIREAIHKAGGVKAPLKTLHDLLFGQYSYLAIKLTLAKMERERMQI
ncbi:MAG: DNA helicase RecQ [Saprospiraceae bacterium]|jgi:ATP-dependent DNA helicase RecQ|nr:DNA helicase RecQ [Saprospiraceae bacterium]MDP5000228.1 DNA helicase RecQ [Saprospiraceae bacterium]